MESRTENKDYRYHGIPYADIIAKYWELYNEGRLPSEGDRNAKTFELAAHLAPICDYSLTILENIVPLYDGLPEDEWRQCIKNGLNQPRKGISYKVQKVLKALRQDQNFSELGGSFSRPPQQPAKLPPLLRDLLRPIPKRYQAYVSEACFPALGTHMHRVYFRTVVNELREPNLMAVSVAPSNAGKASADKPISFILAPIKASDAMAVEEENEWKRKNPTGKTKAKDPRPDICIQVLVDNLTEAAFNLRVIDANRNEARRLYLKVDELEALRNITSKRSMEEVSLLSRKAFDNAEHGQGRVGPDSVSGSAPLRFNYNASTTPARAIKLLRNAIIDGTIGRINVLTIMADADDDELPIFGDFDEKYAARLVPYLRRLDQASGVIDSPKMRKFFLTLNEENKDIAARLGSAAYENLMHRALIIAQSKAVILYIAHGRKWTKEIEDYVRWSLRMDMLCKLHFFGESFEEQFAAEKAAVSAGPRDLISQLPDEFTEEQYLELRKRQGCKGNGKATLRKWKNRQYIYFDDISATFVKTGKGKKNLA